MSYSITVFPREHYLEVKEQRFNEFKEKCVSKKEVPILLSTLKPVRTDINFFKDISLPTTLNHAIKVKKIALKILAILGAFILDLVTFPIRLINAIPRVIWNKNREEHPLFIQLSKSGYREKPNTLRIVFKENSEKTEQIVHLVEVPGKTFI